MEPNSNADAKIEALLKGKAGASATEGHEIIRSEGTEKLITQRLQPGQVDASVHFSTWVEEDPKPAGPRVADQRNIDPPAPDPADAIEIGNVIIRPNMIVGTWEGAFTRGGQASHEVLVNGRRVLGDSGIAAVYAALREQATKGRK